MNPLRILLLAGAGVIVGIGVVLGVTGTNPLDLLRPAGVETPQVPEAKAPAAEDSAQEPAAETGTGTARDIVPPAFSVVRVEPDGSLVVAGTADSQAVVDLMTGTRSLGNTTAGPGGDFAIVLDEPLKPGNYQLVLRATSPDGTVAASPETAVVSVPETPSGQVLALVEKPGEPSRLITKPEPEPAAKPAATAEQPAEESKTAPAGEAAQPAPAAGDASETKIEAAAKEPVTQAAAGEDATAKAPESQDEAPQPEPEQKVAADGAKPAGETQPAAEPASAAAPSVLVEAVEIEGRAIFVAGQGTPGKRVRVYANEILLGESKVSESGRFLVETERDLPVGDYIIRADMLELTGVAVIARAAVPFEREAGEAVAAVAPAADGKQERLTTPPAEPAAGTAAEAEAEPAPKPADGEEVAVAGPQASDEAMQQKDEAEQPAAAGGPEAVVAPKLEAAGGSVIIRRGDSLWRISRRVYGRGIRYSTIYLANQEQISDPDKIWPGQVFRVPGETPEGETADMSTVATPDNGEEQQK
ncbi:MAG: LysM peptidoglycan-binding domain-containing protein [Notoacmeibacter sp.]|nr:LysM peptidoglycan-binding domain-containing protein [Notoacmeibacter sp.]